MVSVVAEAASAHQISTAVPPEPVAAKLPTAFVKAVPPEVPRLNAGSGPARSPLAIEKIRITFDAAGNCVPPLTLVNESGEGSVV